MVPRICCLNDPEPISSLLQVSLPGSSYQKQRSQPIWPVCTKRGIWEADSGVCRGRLCIWAGIWASDGGWEGRSMNPDLSIWG